MSGLCPSLPEFDAPQRQTKAGCSCVGVSNRDPCETKNRGPTYLLIVHITVRIRTVQTIHLLKHTFFACACVQRYWASWLTSTGCSRCSSFQIPSKIMVSA